MMHPYVVEEFTAEERAVLERYFTNADRPVFALKNLPELLKATLFARYSRTQKSLRRLFLDEFYRGDGVAVGGQPDEMASAKASEVFNRIFIEFGDDSVAQLGGAHIAVEQASNILTKQLEWGRLAAYLEQSTRYVSYADRPGGRWRFYREPDVMASPSGALYEQTLGEIFALYAASVPRAIDAFKDRFPQQPGDTPGVYTATIRAKAFDTLRGMLPAATVSNVGIFGTGQFYEQTLLRMRASPLAEVRDVATMMLSELNQVIPAFLRRVEEPDRGGVWTEYLRARRDEAREVASAVLSDEKPEARALVTLVDWDPDGEEKMIAAMLYASSDLPDDQLRARVRRMSDDERARVLRAYVGDRHNRRHKPGRALEATGYRFDVLADYGAFRDLQRHRMLSMEWQDLTPRHGFEAASDLDDLGVGAEFREAMERSESLWAQIAPDLPAQAQYAVCMAYRIRFVMQLNARAAMHLIELRSSPQGHPAYRAVAHEMHRQIADVAGHKAVAALMTHVDRSSVDLERLAAERRAELKRRAE